MLKVMGGKGNIVIIEGGKGSLTMPSTGPARC
jgi:hypothetical protein